MIASTPRIRQSCFGDTKKKPSSPHTHHSHSLCCNTEAEGVEIPLATMKDDPTRPPRLRSNEALRLEGLILQKRLGLVERTCYLVIDFRAGSISVYKSPPPSSDQQHSSSRSLPSKILSSANFSRSKSDSDEGVRKVSNLTHLSRQLRDFESGLWDPTFTVPSSIGWKIRDIENNKTGFYLVLPPEFKKIDSKAEVLTCYREGRRVSYTHMSIPGSIKEGVETVGASGLDSWVHTRNASDDDDNNSVSTTASKRSGLSLLRKIKRRNASDDDDNNSVSTTASKKSGLSLFRKKKRVPAGDQEVVYLFRVLLDGNEKFIWLQAAAELGRLAEPAILCHVPFDSVINKIGFGRSYTTGHYLRYAEWAQLVGKKQTVSKFHFDVHHAGNEREPQDKVDMSDGSYRYNSTHLLNVKPTHAYKNRKMTERDLHREMMITSDKWEDFRTQTVGDRDEEMIGSLHVEVLACRGLPKLDTFSGTDAVCYFVCGPYAFASDVINGFLSPVWPRKSRRACIFPLYHAYQKLYVGVFDDDGAREKDDFAGRVVVDMARLRPNSVYDVYFPLRLHQNTYVRQARGAIHLRFRVEWNDERKALLSYLKLPKKTEVLGNAVTVNCSDYKAFRNVVLTVQGKDVPGRYKMSVHRALQREMKLYKVSIQTTIKELILDTVHYAHPLISICVFFAWMHVVYSNSLAYVPVYFVAGIIAFLLRNYMKYGVGQESQYPHFGFFPIKLSELVNVLLFGGPGTSYMKPLIVTASTLAAARSKSSFDELDGDDQGMLQQAASGVGIVRMDGDHMEFPFSQAGRYPKRTHLEAMGDAAALFLDDDDDEEPEPTRDMISPSLDEQEMEQEVGNEPTDNTVADKLWKRVKDPPGLPEQDARVAVKATRTLKEEIVHNKNLLHKYTMRLFDDRMFIINKYDPGHSTDVDIALKQALYTRDKNPVVAKIAEYGGPSLEALKVGLSMWRAIFNLFLWRDPFLTYLFFIGAVLLLCLLLVFPWRQFFFAVGFGAFGPQNWLVRVYRKEKNKNEELNDPLSPPATAVGRGFGGLSPFRNKRKGKLAPCDATKTTGLHFRFHNHLTTANGIDVRAERAHKSGCAVHRAVVPNSPLLSRRFYDWPPNPALSKVEFYSK